MLTVVLFVLSVILATAYLYQWRARKEEERQKHKLECSLESAAKVVIESAVDRATNTLMLLPGSPRVKIVAKETAHKERTIFVYDSDADKLPALRLVLNYDDDGCCRVLARLNTKIWEGTSGPFADLPAAVNKLIEMAAHLPAFAMSKCH